NDVIAKIRHIRLPRDRWLIARRQKNSFALALRRKELPAVVAGDGDVEDDPGLARRRKARAGEMLGAAELTRFGQDTMPAAHLRVEMTAQRRLAFFAQPPGAVLDHLAPDLGHARGGRARPR